MANQPAPGRAGVVPWPERCSICGRSVDLRQTRDGNRLCYPCYADYEAACDAQAEEALHREEHATTESEEAALAEGVPDALAPWLRTVADYAIRH